MINPQTPSSSSQSRLLKTFSKKESKCASVKSKDTLIARLKQENSELRDENFQLRRRLGETEETDKQRINLIVSDRMLQKVTHITAKHHRCLDFLQKMTMDFEKTQEELNALKMSCIATGALKATKACDVMDRKLLLDRYSTDLQSLEEEPFFDSFIKKPSIQSFTEPDVDDGSFVTNLPGTLRVEPNELSRTFDTVKDDKNGMAASTSFSTNDENRESLINPSFTPPAEVEHKFLQSPGRSKWINVVERRKENIRPPELEAPSQRPKRRAAPSALKEKSLKGKMRRQ
ncbi:unnamed protein product [Bursaphelenchus xylophilus]|uniref:(pine wood nematode) hypothetical protein n=1 Tax=Bursaphelenchus xylophilus TaxID=6326 RepID=A0A1I7S305_BURXY|nr:unnamed protein product [Bursaphelenchus xylophilus]CAG9116052.1 unnamed protein product [Bursaphelenchus xylophilus]